MDDHTTRNGIDHFNVLRCRRTINVANSEHKYSALLSSTEYTIDRIQLIELNAFSATICCVVLVLLSLTISFIDWMVARCQLLVPNCNDPQLW